MVGCSHCGVCGGGSVWCLCGEWYGSGDMYGGGVFVVSGWCDVWVNGMVVVICMVVVFMWCVGGGGGGLMAWKWGWGGG